MGRRLAQRFGNLDPKLGLGPGACGPGGDLAGGARHDGGRSVTVGSEGAERRGGEAKGHVITYLRGYSLTGQKFVFPSRPGLPSRPTIGVKA